MVYPPEFCAGGASESSVSMGCQTTPVNTQTAHTSSTYTPTPLFHETLLLKYKSKDKIIKTFRAVTVDKPLLRLGPHTSARVRHRGARPELPHLASGATAANSLPSHPLQPAARGDSL